MKRQLKKIVCLALITSMILGQKTLKTTKNVTAKEKKDIKIAIDAGHQARGNFAMEPVGPGSSTRKAKVAGGATGVASHVPEYKLTLAVSKKLQKELKARGYKVYMIRTKNNVNISNKKRAQLANKSGAEYMQIVQTQELLLVRVGYIRQKQTDMFQSLVQNPKNYLHVCSSLIVKKQRYATEVWLQEMTLQEQTGARYRFLLLKWDF